VVLALSAAPAQPVAVVDIEAPELMGLGSQVTRKVLESAKAQKLKVLTPDDLRSKLDEKKYDLLKKCKGGPACVAQSLGGLGAKSAVVGELTRNETSYLLKLWLIDLDKLEVVADVDRAILIASRRFQKDVDQAVPALLRGEREARGTLLVQANLADAQVSLNGDFVGVPPVKLQLKPGKYQVKLERRKYLSVTRFVDVEANKTTTEKIKLLLKPGEVPDEAEVPAIVAKKGAKEEKPLTLTAPTWISGGVTVIAAGAGLVYGLGARAGDQKLISGLDVDKQVYAGTRADALKVQQDALVANVAWGVTGVAALCTAFFAWRDANADHAPAVQVAPVAGPNGPGVVVGGTF